MNWTLNPGQRKRSLTLFCSHQSVMVFTICYVISSVHIKNLKVRASWFEFGDFKKIRYSRYGEMQLEAISSISFWPICFPRRYDFTAKKLFLTISSTLSFFCKRRATRTLIYTPLYWHHILQKILWGEFPS